MEYTIKQIIEPDYGCEERADDYVAMDKVILVDNNGEEITIEVSDVELFNKNIDIGDKIFFDKDNQINKEM